MKHLRNIHKMTKQLTHKLINMLHKRKKESKKIKWKKTACADCRHQQNIKKATAEI